MAWSSEIIAKLGLDTTTFNTQLQAVPGIVERTGKKAAGVLSQTFNFGSIAKGFLSGLGIGSALAVIDKLSSAISDSIQHASKLSLIFDEIASSARAASESISRVGKSEGDIIELLGNKLDALKKKRDDLLNDTGSKSFFAGIIEKGSALDKLFGFTRDEEITRAEKLKKLNQEIGRTMVESQVKRQALSEAGDREELRRLNEIARREDERDAAARDVAELDREQRRGKMTDEARLFDLQKERAEVSKSIAEYEKQVREGVELTVDGNKELLALKRQQAVVEERILDLTQQKVAVEAAAVVKSANAAAGRQGFEKLTEREERAIMDWIAGGKKGPPPVTRQGDLRDTINSGNTFSFLIDGKWFAGSPRPVSDFQNATVGGLNEFIRRREADRRGIQDNFATGATALTDVVSGGLVRNFATLVIGDEINRAKARLAEIDRFSRTDRETARRQFEGDPLQFDRLYDAARNTLDQSRETNRQLAELNQLIRRGIGVVDLSSRPR